MSEQSSTNQTVKVAEEKNSDNLSCKIPKDYLYWSILSTVFCNVCFGIAAIFFSLKTRENIRVQNLTNAQQQSSVALRLNLTAVLFNFIIVTVYSIYNMINLLDH